MGVHGPVVVAGVLAVTGTLTGVLAAYVWRRYSEAGADWFVALMSANTVWVGTDLVGQFATSRLGLLAVDRLSTVLATVVPSLWFCFVLAYTGREHLLDRRGVAAVWAVLSLVVAAILTSTTHDLYYRTVEFSVRSGELALVSRPGPLAWVNLAYFAVLVVVGLSLLARLFRSADRLYTRQAGWLLVGTLAPVALLAALFGLGATERFPALSLGFSVLGFAYAHGLVTHRLFDLSPASRRIGLTEAFDDLGEGVVVTTADRDVVAVNDRACRLFACERDAVLGRPLAAVSETLADLDRSTDGTDVRVNGRVLAVSVSAVRDTRDRLAGYALVARDVTDDRRREQRLAVLDRVFRHNIRNTMNAVVGPTAILAKELDGDEREMAETARDASETVLSLSESVHEVERMMTRPLTPAPVPVADVVDNVVTSVRDRADFAADVSVPPDLTVVTDSAVLGDAVENAVEHSSTSPGSQARQDAVEHSSTSPRSSSTHEDSAERSSAGSRTQSDDAVEHSSTSPGPQTGEGGDESVDGGDPTVEVVAESHGSGCLIHVTDDGPGIPGAELDAVRSGAETDLAHGSGIGLWAIHWGVTRLDGAVRFRDRDDGTRVTLWVPSLDPDAHANAETSADHVRPDAGDHATASADAPAATDSTADDDPATDDWFGSTVPPGTNRADD